MRVADAIELVAALADAESRSEAAENLAHALGAEHALVFLHDANADAMLPAPGWRKTLPGGKEWRELLAQSRSAGVHRSAVPWTAGQPPSPTLACSENGLALVFVGGEVRNEDAGLIRSMIPLLKAALSAQHALLATAGELQAAQSEIRQAAALMQALDETRSQLDRSLLERDRQAQSLERARVRAEQATRSKDEFMAMLGHELRNPLSPIKSALDLLKMRGVWSMEHDVMQRQVGHMIRLVDDLLDVSRIAGGKLTLDRAPTQISTVISRALETVAPMAIARRQKITVNVPARGLCVFGDAARLAQVFSNLLTNASKYSDADSAIDISAWQDDATIHVRIRDQGIGIDPAMLEDVFTLFHQQGRGIDRAQGGWALAWRSSAIWSRCTTARLRPTAPDRAAAAHSWWNCPHAGTSKLEWRRCRCHPASASRSPASTAASCWLTTTLTRVKRLRVRSLQPATRSARLPMPSRL